MPEAEPERGSAAEPEQPEGGSAINEKLRCINHRSSFTLDTRIFFLVVGVAISTNLTGTGTGTGPAGTGTGTGTGPGTGRLRVP